MISDTIQDLTHLDSNPGDGQVVAKHLGAVGIREYCGIDILADLAFVDIKSRYNFNVSGCVSAYFPVHQANCIIRALIAIIVKPLHEGPGTISQPGYRNFDLTHICYPSFRSKTPFLIRASLRYRVKLKPRQQMLIKSKKKLLGVYMADERLRYHH